jgi:uncharacterized membrane protein
MRTIDLLRRHRKGRRFALAALVIMIATLNLFLWPEYGDGFIKHPESYFIVIGISVIVISASVLVIVEFVWWVVAGFYNDEKD